MSELNTVKVLEEYKKTQDRIDKLCGMAMNAEQKASMEAFIVSFVEIVA